MTIIGIFTSFSLLCFWVLALIAKMYFVLRSFDGIFFSLFFCKGDVSSFSLLATLPQRKVHSVGVAHGVPCEAVVNKQRRQTSGHEMMEA